MQLRAPVNIKMLKQAKQRKPLRRAREEVAGGEEVREVGGGAGGKHLLAVKSMPRGVTQLIHAEIH